MSKWTPKSGEIVGGRYVLGAQLGRGAMGTVFRAQHVALGSPAAVKVIDPELIETSGSDQVAELEGRFLEEAQAAASLNSAHVVRVLDYGMEQGSPYIAMELLEGETLAQRMQRVGILPADLTLKILSQVARAIAKGHDAGIVHRDLKPENIFLARVDDDEVAKVLDFGIAKMTKSPMHQQVKTTRRGEIIGTPCYMSPEQISGRGPIDAQVDVWAIGVMAFECLTGRLPFDADTVGGFALAICGPERPIPSQICRVPSGFDGWWARASRLNRADRFADVREAISSLTTVLAEGTPAPGPSSRGHSMSDPISAPVARAFVDRSTQQTMAGPSRPMMTSGLLFAAGALLVVSLALGSWLYFRPGGAGHARPATIDAATSSPTAAPDETTSSARGGDMAIEPADSRPVRVDETPPPSASPGSSAQLPKASASARPTGPRPKPPAHEPPSTDPRLGL